MKIKQKHFKSMDDLNEWAKTLPQYQLVRDTIISININSASIIVFYWSNVDEDL